MARLSGRPLLDTRADSALFVDRADELALLDRAVGEGLNALLVGDPGSGKTSLLHRVVAARRAGTGGGDSVRAGTGDGDAVLLDLSAVGDVGDVLDRVAARLGETPVGPGSHPLDRLAGLIDADLGPTRVVLLDGLPVRLAHPLFGQLRDELWRVPVCWVVTCAAAQEAAFRQPPADAFFDVVVRLGGLGDDAVRELLRRRADVTELDEDAVDEVVALAAGSPRRALDAARRVLFDPGSRHRLAADERRRRELLEPLGRPAAMLLAELEALDGASASDERLLSRLGWTRARAAQVLGQLESAGLVTATDERHGPGRPRRIYSPTGRMSG